jgi:hypothetical protein
LKNLEAPVKFLVLSLGLCTLAAAQAPPGGHRSSPPTYTGPTRTMVQNPRFMSRLFQMRVTRIQQVLGLSEDRARVVAERWGRWDREHLEQGELAVDLRKQFHQILLGPEREEDKNLKLKPLVDQFMAVRRQQEAGRKQFEEEIRNGLTPAQQARLILVMEEIQQKLREGLRDVKRDKKD